MSRANHDLTFLSYFFEIFIDSNWITKKHIKESHAYMICINIKNCGMTYDSTKLPKSPTESTKNIKSRLQAFDMKAFSWFWWCFCMIHDTHVHNILHHQKVPRKLDSMYVMLFVWWYHVVVLWNHQSHSKCCHLYNSWLIFWDVFLIFVRFLSVCFF